MIFKRLSEIEGKHALLSPSQCSWLNYESEEDFFSKYKSAYAQTIGTLVHELAKDLIENKIKLTKNDRKVVTLHLSKHDIPRSVWELDRWYPTLMNYVNDAIGYGMTPEVGLMYSENAFGTTDSISFRDNFLRIHDLKTGKLPAKMEQLLCYAGYFCLQYDVNPSKIDSELRIYQNGEILYHKPEGEEIDIVMEKIKNADRLIRQFKEQEK